MSNKIKNDNKSKEEKLSQQDSALLLLANLMNLIIVLFATYFTIKIGWNWYLTKIFTISTIGFPQVLALMTIIGFVRFNIALNSFVRKEQKPTPTTVMKNTFIVVSTYFFTLVCLWIISTLI